MILGLTTFQLFSIYILLCAAFMYIVIMGPSRFHRNGVVGWMHRMLFAAPKLIGTLLLLPCCGCRWERAAQSYTRMEDRVMNKKNPAMMIFYIALIGSAEYFYLCFTVPLLPSVERKAASWFFIIVSEVFFVWAVVADPGRVTPAGELAQQASGYDESVRFQSAQQKAWRRMYLLSPKEEQHQSRRYVVDDILYGISTKQTVTLPQGGVAAPPHGVVCVTCNVPRPSRSKHCRLCGHCVRRFDHHCPWINNDVGENNHRIFLMFLLSHVVSCFWASADAVSILLDIVVGRRLIGAVFLEGGRRVKATWIHILFYLVNSEIVICCVFLFTFLVGLLLLGFWAYQMRMVLLNVTSNDLNKIDDVTDFLWNQATAAEAETEAKLIAEKVFQWRGEKVALPEFPECLAYQKRQSSKGAEPTDNVPTTEMTADQKKASIKYRKAVEKAIEKSLKRTFHTGSWLKNLREVLFPYEDTAFHKRWVKELQPKAARREKIFGGYSMDGVKTTEKKKK